MYCTSEEVIKNTGVNRKKLGFKDDEIEFQNLLSDWINQAESMINSYCKRNWYHYIDDDGKKVEVKVPGAVKNVCIRLVSNMIAFYFKRRDDPIRKVNEYTVKVFESDVFTDDLKADLKPFKKSSKVSIFKI